jgi:hypothetical protein
MENMKDKARKHGQMGTSKREHGKMVSSMVQGKLTAQKLERKPLSNGEKEKSGILQQFKKRK